MESEDDTHDTNDVDSDEGLYSDDNDFGYSYCQDDDDAAAAYSDEDGCFQSDDDDRIKMIQDRRPENSYIVLKESDIKERQEADITSVSSVLSISRAASIILLRHYNWNVGQVHEAWFSDDDKVRKSVGLLPTADPVVQFPGSRGELTCGICFDDFPSTSMKSAACSHHFCFECWEGYIRTSINDGPECLMLRCPDPSCGAAVGQDMITMLASDEYKRKYFQYLRRSYIEDNKKNKWCPGPGCENAINYVGDNVNYDVSCLCSHSFCWNCTEETHRPVDCSTVRLWIIKNSAESENMNWILANSKSCPKCQRPIEKNHGCMHMTCKAPCRFQFCWLCLGAWSDHNNNKGGFYACNRYEKAKREGVYDESERKRKMAKNSLERYAHYYERWASNESSRQKALGDLHKMKTVNMEKLSVIQRKPEPQLEFLSDAWQQIAECRRMLKWTYAYGYYLPEHEIKDKKHFFEHLQNQAESALEWLHQCAEKELSTFLNADEPSIEFVEFQTKLIGLTAVTKSYFENLVMALENNLSYEILEPAEAKEKLGRKRKGSASRAGGRGGSSRN